ncbi:MAG: hypothetical protein AMXMBFR53_09110 [Gemmatimonadota bacterium]
MEYRTRETLSWTEPEPLEERFGIGSVMDDQRHLLKLRRDREHLAGISGHGVSEQYKPGREPPYTRIRLKTARDLSE